MAKAKQRAAASAAQRREQVREQRQQRQTGGQNIQAQSRNRNSRRRKSSRSPWLLIGGVLVVIAVAVGIFIYVARQSGSGTAHVDSTVLNAVTHVDQSVLSQVSTGSAKNAMHATKAGTPMLKGPDGKPEVFYTGGEYCPYCAAQRWAMVVALSRFGTFDHLSQITASEGNVSTFTFHGSTYKSQYIDFVPVEQSDNNQNPFETLTADQQQLFKTYDAPPYVDANSAGSIPFIDIANQQVSSGAYYSEQVLQNLSWQDIANQLKDPNTDVSKGILGSANYLIAAICVATQNQPTNVCTADPIPQLEQSLPKASVGPAEAQVGLVGDQFELVTRRQE